MKKSKQRGQGGPSSMAKFYSRYDAATVLRHVAEEAEHGMYPVGVTPFEFGRAVARAIVNCGWADVPSVNFQANVGELLRGIYHARDEQGNQVTKKGKEKKGRAT